jgi:NAD(P)-dependent dehydrogenase (short-subunit alcohol dehydrogenase family)
VIAAARHTGEELHRIANVTPVAVDLTDPAAAEQLVAQAENLDILVNNVGGVTEQSIAAGGFLDIADSSWQQTYELNLFATVRVIRHALPKLIATRGVIINVLVCV